MKIFSAKKLIVIMLAIILCFGLGLNFIGCGEGEIDTSIPLDVDMSKKPNLNIHLQPVGISNEALNSESSVALLEELTGYKVNYSQMSAAEENGPINYLLEGKAQYHAIKVSKAQYNALLAKNYLLNIKPALEKFGADIYKTTGDGDITDYSWSVVSKDGGIYGIPEGGPPTPGQVNVEKTIFFRSDLLMEEGLRMPKNLEEFRNILKHFKDKNTDSAFRPFTFNMTDGLIAPIAVAFGIYQEWFESGGEYKFYYELPQYKEYMNYMISLYNEGLIDLEVTTQDKAKSIAKFGKGNAIAIASSVWDSDIIQNALYDTYPADKGTVTIAALKALLDPNGEIKTFHGGGYPYITVIPKYMNQQAAYTVDHLIKKLQKDNFKRLTIGDEGVHYYKNGNEYRAVFPEFEEKNMASFYCTGINERYYPDYFLCRIDGKVVKDFFIELNNNSDAEGTYNPLNFTPYLAYYDGVRVTIEKRVNDEAMKMMFVTKNINNYDSVLTTWRNGGGTQGKTEINKWITDSGWNY